MLRLFKQSAPVQIAAIIIAAALLWVRAFIEPVPMAPEHHFAPIYWLFYSWLSMSPRLASAVALVFVVAEGLWLNIILVDHKAARANSLMPTLLYLLTMSWNAADLTITPILLVNIMVIAAFSQLLSGGATSLSASRNFNAAFCIGLAALCYMPALSYILPFLFVFIIYKLYRWRDVVVSLLGLVAPSIVFLTYAFIKDRLQYDLILISHDFLDVNIMWNRTPVVETICAVVFVVIFVLALLYTLTNMNEKMIQQRINNGVISLPILAAIVIMLMSRITPLNTQLLAPTFAFTASHYLYADRKKAWIGEAIFWTIVVASII